MLPLRGYRWGSTRRAASLRRAAQLCTLAALIGTAFLSQQRASADPVTIARISVSPLAPETDGPSGAPLISADGSTVVFQSSATNLVAGDTNGADDVFAAPAAGGSPQLISVGPDGEPADGSSTPLAVTPDGRFVVFATMADNLGVQVPHGVVEIYVFDRQTGNIDLVSKATSNAPGNRSSGAAAISADGRYVAFTSVASNLVPGDTNGVEDVFVRDRVNNTISRVDLGPHGTQANAGADPQVVSMSADGSVVAFSSLASNLVSGDTYGKWNVYVRYRPWGATSRISVPQRGASGNGRSLFPSVSADGKLVAFESTAPLTAGVTPGSWNTFIRNRGNGSLMRVPVPSAGPPQISADGTTVGFLSTAVPLVPEGAVGVVTWSLATREAELATVDAAGDASTGHVSAFSLDGNGGTVAFATDGSDLVAGDLNGMPDVYVHFAQTS